MTNDSLKLLKECDAGLKMAIYDLDNINSGIKSEELKKIVEASRKEHIKIKSETENILKKSGEDEKDPPAVAKGMAYFKTNLKMLTEENDKAAARLLWDGCFMGIKTVIGYINEFKNAETSSKDVAKNIIKIEEQLLKDVKCYL